MSTAKHRVVFSSASAGPLTLYHASESRENNIIADDSISHSFGYFPKAELTIINRPEVIKYLGNINSENVIIELFTKWSGAEEVKLFHGIVRKQKFTIDQKNDSSSLKVWAVSPFIRLADSYLSDSTIEGCSTLRNMLDILEEIVECNTHITVESSVDNSLEISMINNFPALGLLDVISKQKNLVIHIPVGDILELIPSRLFYGPRRVHKINLDDTPGWTMTRDQGF